MSHAFIFPGQGAQQVGMGKDLYEAFAAARTVFDIAEDVTKLPLKKLCFDGPEDELSRTNVCQPAIFTVSAALLACLDSLLEPAKVEALRPPFMAGLSLGEYTALYAADMIDFQDALRLVALRGAAMQKAATAVPSGMVAVMGLDEDKANELCTAAADGGVLVPANFNAAGQVVLSGSLEACKRAEAMAKDFGASGAVGLKVAGAFHSPLMQPAADELGEALDGVEFRSPRGLAVSTDLAASGDASRAQAFSQPDTEVIANVNALPYGCPCRSKAMLMAQLTGSVRWQQSMQYLLGQGVTKFYEIGPGKVLAGLMRRIDRKAEVVTINSRQSLEMVVAGM